MLQPAPLTISKRNVNIFFIHIIINATMIRLKSGDGKDGLPALISGNISITYRLGELKRTAVEKKTVKYRYEYKITFKFYQPLPKILLNAQKISIASGTP